MILYMFLYGTLLIATVQSGNVTLSEVKNQTYVTEDGAKSNVLNKAKLTLVSEGGTLLPNTPDLTSPKEKLNSLITLDEELSKTKEKSVVPRKGVDMPIDEIKSSQIETKTLDANKGDLTANITSAPDKLTDIKAKNVSLGVQTKDSNVNKTEVPKKPLVTSYEALTNMYKQIQGDHSKMPVAPSTKTLASSQIPSPNQEPIKKVYPSKATNSHPGMIMPIVITILVVPMFAIVGYFALKRGQEAWKNRHYKRMDFLLDGMYND